MIVLEEKANKPSGKVELKSVADAIVDFFQEKEIKSLADLKKVSGEEFELKADNQMTTTFTNRVLSVALNLFLKLASHVYDLWRSYVRESPQVLLMLVNLY